MREAWWYLDALGSNLLPLGCFSLLTCELQMILPRAHHGGKQKLASLVAPTSIAVKSKQSDVLVAEPFGGFNKP